MSYLFVMQLIIHMFQAPLIPSISLDQYLNPNLYTIPNMQNMRFFCCSVYIQARRDIITTLSTFCVPSLNNLLYGDTNLNNHHNKLTFQTVQKYISDNKRFVLD